VAEMKLIDEVAAQRGGQINVHRFRIPVP
jgi:hypothetical protein